MELKFILESILFSAQEPLTAKELKAFLATAAEQAEDSVPKAFKKTSIDDINNTLEQLAQEHAQGGRSFRLACVAGAWQFFSEPEYAPWIKALVGHKNRPTRLSQPALQTLVDRGLVEQVGRAEVPGRPMTYGTTPVFLEYFGLRNLEGLPAADELRRVVVQKPETLLTVDPGLATAPPEDLKVVNPQAADPALAENAPSATPEHKPEFETANSELVPPPGE